LVKVDTTLTVRKPREVYGIIGLVYSGYLLYVGIPHFLNIDSREGFIFSSWTLAIGVLVLEFLLGLTVVLWGYGSWFF
jgi:hypothetical protein